MKRPGGSDEAGSTALEVAIVFPAVIILITLAVQFALLQHANHVADAAAQEGGRVARAYDGNPEMARERAGQALAMWGPNVVLQPSVVVTEDATEAGVEISGTAPQVLPGIRLKVSAMSRGPREVFRPDVDGAR